jgi:hypothetical protein
VGGVWLIGLVVNQAGFDALLGVMKNTAIITFCIVRDARDRAMSR